MTSILVVVISFLLEQYNRHRDGVEYRWKPYSRLVKIMSVALIVSGITAVLSLLYLVGPLEIELVRQAVEWLFIIAVLIVVIGTSLTVYTTLRR